MLLQTGRRQATIVIFVLPLLSLTNTDHDRPNHGVFVMEFRKGGKLDTTKTFISIEQA